MEKKVQMDKIDKNFVIASALQQTDIVWQEVREEPFTVYGLYDYKNQMPFCRIPWEVAKSTSEGVTALNTHTAGGRVTFRTDSPYVALKAYLPFVAPMDHMAFSGTMGFDLEEYRDGKSQHIYSFRPGTDLKTEIDGIAQFASAQMRDFTVNFPLYGGVERLYIGVAEGSKLLAAENHYVNRLPAVFYGSSITQGGCASRPGTSYQGFLSRMLNLNYVNLGFSGNGKAEDVIVDYMAHLPMSAFISDYDHNAPSAEYLDRTCRKMYQVIRAANPELPYVFVSKPDFWGTENCIRRRDIIRHIYEEAVHSGDKKVWFIDGETLFAGECANDCTVDRCHPTDLGFFRMASVMKPVLQEIYGL